MSTTTTSKSEAASDSFLARTLFAPILFLSFLFSLLWIDRKTSAEIFTHDEPKLKSRKKSDPQHYHSHQRHLAKRELEDAFAYQGKVVILLCVGSAVALVVASWSVWRFWQWEFGAESFWKVGRGASEI
jgi:hypothetical protein